MLVVEDHAATREAILAVIRGEPAWDASGVASLAALDAAIAPPDARFDVALVDLHLGGESGLDAIARLTGLDVPCVMLTISDSGADVDAALKRGAVGYLLKDDPPALVLQALRDAVGGKHPISSGVAGHLMARSAGVDGRTAAELATLTPRERDVLVALARGLSYAEVASALGCALSTVQTHVKRVYGKLGVNSKTEACAWAYSAGIVE